MQTVNNSQFLMSLSANCIGMLIKSDFPGINLFLKIKHKNKIRFFLILISNDNVRAWLQRCGYRVVTSRWAGTEGLHHFTPPAPPDPSQSEIFQNGTGTKEMAPTSERTSWRDITITASIRVSSQWVRETISPLPGSAHQNNEVSKTN